MFGSENAKKSCLQFGVCRQRRKLIILSSLIENGIEGMAVGKNFNVVIWDDWVANNNMAVIL